MESVGLTGYLGVGAILFVCGVICMATKRNGIGVLMGVELVLNGANVNFVEVQNNKVHMRIYEKGVENETLSSGTGATAVALALAHAQHRSSPVAVHTRGGVLEISFTPAGSGSFKQVYMAGPAQMVFQGTVFV